MANSPDTPLSILELLQKQLQALMAMPPNKPTEEVSEMSKTVNEAASKISIAEIVHHGEKLMLPEGMSIDNAIALLNRRNTYMMEPVELRESFEVFPWDGAYALDVVLKQKYGWSPSETRVTQTPFGEMKDPPKMISIEIDYGKVTQIPWGQFSLPGIAGKIQCGAIEKDGRTVFAIRAEIIRKDEQAVLSLFADIREYLKHNSIYRGKAIKIRFLDDDGDRLDMPEPKFLDTSTIDRDALIYSKQVQEAVETSLFTPIERVQDCIENGISIKRGVLLGGTYGTGKTMAAHVASKLAVDNGLTYVYVTHADELAEAIEFAKQYQSPACVIFCEDIDRALSGERSVEMDDILNIIDGIDTKSSNIIVVMTTNDLDSINPAMLRPGRLDAVIEVLPPDADAIEKLLRLYGGEAISQETDLHGVAMLLNGSIPAVVAEVVKRGKLAQLKSQLPGTKLQYISAQALMEAAGTMKRQMDILQNAIAPKVKPVTLDDVMQESVRKALNGSREHIEGMALRVEQMHDKIM